MSSQRTEYKKICTNCNAEILMKNVENKWVALENDASKLHRCYESKGATAITLTRTDEYRGGKSIEVMHDENVEAQDRQTIAINKLADAIFQLSEKKKRWGFF